MAPVARSVVYSVFPEEAERPLGPHHPTQITRWGARKLGVAQWMTAEREQLIANVLHYGYGAFWASVLSAAADGRSKVPLPVLGQMLAVGLWTFGFCGWIPALRISHPAWKMDRVELVATLVAHSAFGIGSGIVLQALQTGPCTREPR